MAATNELSGFNVVFPHRLLLTKKNATALSSISVGRQHFHSDHSGHREYFTTITASEQAVNIHFARFC
jgi:hypothetical protein